MNDVETEMSDLEASKLSRTIQRIENNDPAFFVRIVCCNAQFDSRHDSRVRSMNTDEYLKPLRSV